MRRFLAAGALALGVSGCFYEKPVVKPEPSEYKKLPGAVMDTRYATFLIDDIDGDGTADRIHYLGRCRAVAPGFNDTCRQKETFIMTPSLREAATKSLLADRELSYLLDLEEYEDAVLKRDTRLLREQFDKRQKEIEAANKK